MVSIRKSDISQSHRKSKLANRRYKKVMGGHPIKKGISFQNTIGQLGLEGELVYFCSPKYS